VERSSVLLPAIAQDIEWLSTGFALPSYDNFTKCVEMKCSFEILGNAVHDFWQWLLGCVKDERIFPTLHLLNEFIVLPLR